MQVPSKASVLSDRSFLPFFNVPPTISFQFGSFFGLRSLIKFQKHEKVISCCLFFKRCHVRPGSGSPDSKPDQRTKPFHRKKHPKRKINPCRSKASENTKTKNE